MPVVQPGDAADAVIAMPPPADYGDGPSSSSSNRDSLRQRRNAAKAGRDDSSRTDDDDSQQDATSTQPRPNWKDAWDVAEEAEELEAAWNDDWNREFTAFLNSKRFVNR